MRVSPLISHKIVIFDMQWVYDGIDQDIITYGFCQFNMLLMKMCIHD